MNITEMSDALASDVAEFIARTALDLSLVSEDAAALSIRTLKALMVEQNHSEAEAIEITNQILTMVVLHRADIINGAGTISTRMH